MDLSFKDLLSINRRDDYDYYVSRERHRDIPKALIDLRYNTLNKRRYNRKDMIIQERKNIIKIERSMQQRASPASLSLRGDSVDHNTTIDDKRKTIHHFTRAEQLKHMSARDPSVGSQIQSAQGVAGMVSNRSGANNYTSTETGGGRIRNSSNLHTQMMSFHHHNSTSTAVPFPKWVDSHSSQKLRQLGMRSHQRQSSVGPRTTIHGGSSSMMGSGYGGNHKSAIFEQEMKAIRRLKNQQQREIEAMIDHQLQLKQIQDRKESIEQTQKQKEAKQLQDLYLRKMEQEKRKKAGEDKRKDIEEK